MFKFILIDTCMHCGFIYFLGYQFLMILGKLYFCAYLISWLSIILNKTLKRICILLKLDLKLSLPITVSNHKQNTLNVINTIKQSIKT